MKRHGRNLPPSKMAEPFQCGDRREPLITGGVIATAAGAVLLIPAVTRPGQPLSAGHTGLARAGRPEARP